MEKEELCIIKEKLGINDWLELIKEDKNLSSAYISISQYIYLLETQLKKQKEINQKAIEYINQHWTGGYTDNTLKYKIEEINITGLLNILYDKEGNDEK